MIVAAVSANANQLSASRMSCYILPLPCFVKVREIIREIEEDGWIGVRQTGTHRQFRHPSKPGTVTVPGQKGDELAKGRLVALASRTISEAAMMEYAIVIEDAGSNYSAYVPNLPGCVSTGGSVEEATSNIREAITLHIKSLREHGEEVSMPTSRAGTVQVA
jgi:predicted RNase H-like HicB family nuclease/predicted RNA binding protein YcfA (HicA-like mRNA interferase family)